MATPTDRAYSNARRAGRTHPDKVEVIDKNDRRHPAYVPPAAKGSIFKKRPRPNRATRRAMGERFRPATPTRFPAVFPRVHLVQLIGRDADDTAPLVTAANVRDGDQVLFGGQWLPVTETSVSFAKRQVVWTLDGGRQVGFNRDLRLPVAAIVKAA